jgi:hypothetical protein
MRQARTSAGAWIENVDAVADTDGVEKMPYRMMPQPVPEVVL